MSKSISNSDSIIDSRDVISRIEELTSELEDAYEQYKDAFQEDYDGYKDDFVEEHREDLEEPLEFDEWLDWSQLEIHDFDDWKDKDGGAYSDEIEELKGLEDLAEEASSSPDWSYGEGLIRDSYFEEYAEELASDIGAIDKNANWPLNCIDWSGQRTY